MLRESGLEVIPRIAKKVLNGESRIRYFERSHRY